MTSPIGTHAGIVHTRRRGALVALLTLASASAAAVPVTPVNLDDLALGALIVGPVGPEVEVSLVSDAGPAVGDLSSSVSCPDGFATCVPPDNPAGTLYTYRHSVTPGVDLPNDAPFPAPDEVVALDDVTRFALTFPASGFNGIAGYDFGEAAAALADGVMFDIELLSDGSLEWTLADGSGWDTGEVITFFWQTTQPPSGPGGIYSVSNGVNGGSGNGPVPTPVVIIVSEPAVPTLLALVSLATLGWRLASRPRSAHAGGTPR